MFDSANQAIYLALQTLARTGDEVILCEPYFFNMQSVRNYISPVM